MLRLELLDVSLYHAVFGANFYPTVFILIFTPLVLSLNKLSFYLIRRHACVSVFRCVFYSISSSTLFYPYNHCCRLLFNLLLFCLLFFMCAHMTKVSVCDMTKHLLVERTVNFSCLLFRYNSRKKTS